MKAVVLHGVNTPFKYQEFETPQPGEGEYLIKLSYAALNHRDVWIQKGQYAGLKFPIICGSDGCGTIVQAGSGADASRVGEEVIINPSLNWGDNPRVQNKDYVILGLPHDGTFAEYVKVPARLVHKKPGNLTADKAAALPLAGLTAWRALLGRAKAMPGETVLVTGIGGGVALFAAQFAKANGCKVYVTSSSDDKLAKAMGLGFDGAANYKEADWHKRLAKESGGFEVIVDGAGGPDFSKLIDLAKPAGRISVYGATAGSMGIDVPAKLFWKQLDLLGSTMGNETEFTEMVKFVEEKQVVPETEAVFALSQTEEAANYMNDAQQFGKIILSVG